MDATDLISLLIGIIGMGVIALLFDAHDGKTIR